ncbi:hypothetical protein TNCV_1107251 [Trichonephila clavipes]|nr:hypothetical protein TNCV_1107251 [Trichonephila clavipes]
MGSLVVRASDSRLEVLGSMPDTTKYHPSTHGFYAKIVEIGGVAIYRPLGNFTELKRTVTSVWCSRPTIGELLAPCHDEFRGPRSDCSRQVALETTTQYFFN